MFMSSPSSQVESLESRRLFATFIEVSGTAAVDVVEIAATPTGVSVTHNGVKTNYNSEDFVGINVFCDDGDDIVIVGAGVMGIYADGGNGNDRIVGGEGPDTFLGAAGKDQLYG